MARTIKNQYYLKDKKAMIYREAQTTKDKDGFVTNGGYVPLTEAPLWCYSRQLSQEQIYAAMAVGVQEERMFVFNFRKDIAVGCYVAYRNKFYVVTRVDSPEDYLRDTFVYVKQYGRLGIMPDNILPFGTPIVE